MRFGSICSGIEAASVAFGPLDWEPVWFSEIEKFPCAVLAHHYPTIPNLGDMTKIMQSEVFQNEKVDLICGGTPCQSFSIAGLRKGMGDARGNLALEFIRICDAAKPRWVLWENVPGVLSSSGGRDFGSFLGALAEVGYGWAYRVLDAQYFGVPQRRRRVFVVGYLGDWRPAAEVLFECQGLRGNIAEGSQAGKGLAGSPADSSGADSKPLAFKLRGGCEGGGKGYLGSEDKTFTVATHQDQMIFKNYSFYENHEQDSRVKEIKVCPALNASFDNCSSLPIVMAHGQGGAEVFTGKSPTLSCNHEAPIVYENHAQDSRIKEVSTAPQLNAKAGTGGGNLPLVQVASTLRGEGFGASEDGTGRQNLVIAFDHRQDPISGNIPGPLSAKDNGKAIAFTQNQSGDVLTGDVIASIGTNSNASGRNTAKVFCSSVRRLTPTECERLQGFPDGYTAIPYKNKAADKCPDGPRYKALGNSWAVPCARWIGNRIQMVDELLGNKNLVEVKTKTRGKGENTMEKLMKLVDIATVVLEMYAVKLKNEMEASEKEANPMITSEKKERKPRAPKAAEEKVLVQETAPEADLGLGLGVEEKAPAVKELTEKESTVKMEEVTKQFVILHKNDKPEDGKTRAIKMMQTDPRFKVGKLGDLNHAQRLLWIAEMEKGLK